MKITELNDRAEAILKSNIEILYSQLQLAIKNYVRHGHSSGEFCYINAYLSATLNAVISYVDRLIKIGRITETEIIEALKFANNLQKHNPGLISISKSRGGIEFPIAFEDGFEILEIEVVWDDCIALKSRKPSQKIAYEKCFQQKPVIETLEPIIRDLLLS